MQERNFRILWEAAKKLKWRYQRGDEEGLIEKGILKCPDLPSSPLLTRNHLQCNPSYLNCFFSSRLPKLKNHFTVHFEKKQYQVKVKPIDNYNHYYRILTRPSSVKKIPPPHSLHINLSLVEHPGSLSLLLEDTCKTVNLPKRKYVYQEHSGSEKKEHIWDNLNKNISIDKYLVTFRDINEWLQNGGNEKLTLPKDRSLWNIPASSLSIKQMNKYCRFMGKTVASTRVYDAAAFMPIHPEDPLSLDKYFPPYPWSKSATLRKEGDLCSDILSFECSKKMKAIQNSPHQRTSWVGMKDLLGGHPEYLHNPVNPKYNLKVSSFYLKSKSPWHQLGRRASWTGEGFNPKEFHFNEEEIFMHIAKPIKVGFRCMLEELKKNDEES